jgi:hypothetical protein
VAVVMNMSWPAFSAADYDKAREAVGWERDAPPGGRNHVAWIEPGGGLRVVDVWESQEQFDQFANERLMPGLAQAGLLDGKGEPEITFAPLHAHWSPDA